MEKRFRSRVSVIFIILELFFVSLVVITGFNTSDFTLCIIAGVVVIYRIFDLSRKPYVLTDKFLLYKKWGFSSEICHLSHIKSIERSYGDYFYSTFTSAKSLKKLHLRFPKGYKWSYYMMSPAHEQEFLETLKALNPNIQINVNNNKKSRWRFWDWDI